MIIILTAQSDLHAFALVQSMTEGGPYFSTQVIEVFIYQTAFAAGSSESGNAGVTQLGYASAAGCFFGTITLIIAVGQAWAIRKVNQLRSANCARRVTTMTTTLTRPAAPAAPRGDTRPRLRRHRRRTASGSR